MAVTKRDGQWYLYFRPFKDKKIGLKVDVRTKTEAKHVEGAVLRACRIGDYGSLDATSREACVRMFVNQSWELPEGLRATSKPVEELTVWKACELFFKYPEIKANKARWRYECSVVHLVQHLGKDTAMKSIWIPQLKAYQVERTSEGAAPASVNWELSTLSRIFGVLVELQFVQANPVRMVKRLSTKMAERQVYLSFADVQQIAEQCTAWCKPIILAAFYSGMRRGEVLGLTWKQVNLSKRIITLGPESTKEGQWKRVPIHRDLLPVFEEAMKVRAIGTDRVFLLDGRPPNFESLKNPWRKACKRLGLDDPRPRFHDLRHTWKTNARRSGMDPEIREGIMGHWFKEKSVSERYGRIGDHELVQAIDSMSFDNGTTEIYVSRR